MNIATHHYLFMQQFADKPDFVETTCATLARIPVEWHELAIEPLFNDSGCFRASVYAELEAWREGLRAIGKRVPSYYFNFPALQTAFDAREQADFSRYLNTLKSSFPEMETLVSNPVPLDWNDASVIKSDAQLNEQLSKFKTLAKMVREAGFTFAYHFHSPELYDDCREMEFMLANMTSEEMALALDANWCVMAGVDPLKIIRRYQDRIRLVHLRSSHDKIWDETLEDGEEDNRTLVRTLLDNGYKGPWVIEIADNGGSRSLSVDERFRRSVESLRSWLQV